MKPAWSIIVFTVLSGFGLGLSFALVAGVGAEWVRPERALWAGLLGGALTAAGLCSSVLHLANPRNAWRALFRLRSSWLSREGALALLYFPALGAWLFFPQGAALGAAVCALSAGAVFCTAMIYASLRPVRLWRCWLTPANYLLLSGAGGFLLLSATGGSSSSGPLWCFAILTVLSGLGKWLHFRRADAEGALTAGSATGLGAAKVRLLETGHGGGNFLTREFIYKAARGRILLARRIALAGFAAALGLGLCALAWPGSDWILAGAAVPSALAGLLAERWLFFAEARHAVRLYHGEARA